MIRRARLDVGGGGGASNLIWRFRNAAPERQAIAVTGALAISIVVGASIAFAPLPALAGWVALLAGLWLARLGGRVVPVFLRVTAGLLIGYAFLGRGLAHVGIPPLYLGELALGLAVLATIAVLSRARFGLLHGLLLVYMAWGLLRTLPFVGVYGIDALRDSVTWAYAFFALAVSITVAPSHFPRVLGLYRRLIPLFILWVPVAAFIGNLVSLPAAPGSDVPIVAFKGGDMGVHLAGVAAFVLLGLYGATGRVTRFPEWLLWAAWLFAAGVVAIFNRGGMAAMTSAGATILFVRSAGRWFSLVLVALIIVALGLAIDPRVDLGSSREVSFGQLVNNVASILTDGSDPGLQGTKEFRLRWWSTIIDYTVNGDYFWTGKGFGVNLADDDGFQVTADHSLRAPHNGHFEILARTGVPGLLLWVVLQAAFALSLLSAARRARRDGRGLWVAVIGWLFVYWAAAMIDASFDPFLQGPQGGIWFWTIIGLGIAAIDAVRRGVDPFSARPAPDEASGTRLLADTHDAP